MPRIAKPLTSSQVATAKPGTGKTPRRLFDGAGLYLEVSHQGNKFWRLKYALHGAERRMGLGTYPPMTLAEARDAAASARALVAKGISPVQQRKTDQVTAFAAAAATFEVIAREWHEKMSARWKPAQAKTVMGRLEHDLFPYIGRVPVADISKAHALDVIRRIAARGKSETERRVLSNLLQVLAYASQTLRIERVPFASCDVSLSPVRKTSHAALTSPNEVAALLRSIHAYQGSAVTRYALQLATLTAVRPGELRHAEWAEIDIDAARWLIPGAKMKGGADHLVPLSNQAVAMLRSVHQITGSGRYVFPSARTPNGSRPMSDNAVLSALRRMDYSSDQMTGHGVRAIFRTLGDEVLGMRVEWLEMQLAHAVKDVHGTAYNRTKFLQERTTMMQTWANYLDLLRTGTPVPAADNVHQLVRHSA
jgi:integrase